MKLCTGCNVLPCDTGLLCTSDVAACCPRSHNHLQRVTEREGASEGEGTCIPKTVALTSEQLYECPSCVKPKRDSAAGAVQRRSERVGFCGSGDESLATSLPAGNCARDGWEDACREKVVILVCSSVHTLQCSRGVSGSHAHLTKRSLATGKQAPSACNRPLGQQDRILFLGGTWDATERMGLYWCSPQLQSLQGERVRQAWLPTAC
eukprot:15969-Heterococcus_DN1.PRE.1